MRESIRRALAGLLAIALVSTAAAPVGTAAADHKCKTDDVTWGLVITASAETKDAILGSSSSEKLDGTDGGGGDLLGCDLFHGSMDTDSLEGVDKAQQKNEIISAAAVSSQWANNTRVGWENGAYGLETEGRLDGLAAYGRALDNNTTKAGTKSAVQDELDAYFASKQRSLISDWNTQALAWVDYGNQSQVEGISSNFVQLNIRTAGAGDIQYAVNRSHTLVGDQGTANVVAIHTSAFGTDTEDPFENLRDFPLGESGPPEWELAAGLNNNSYEDIHGPFAGDYYEAMEDIRYAHQNASAGLDTYIEQTYANASSGEIDWAQVVGASAIARNFAADGSFQNWAATRLRNMQGVGMPTNLSQVGYYTVTHDNQTASGVLASDGNPPSGAFERGETYNGSELSGPQYLIGNESLVNLDGQFTIDDITNDQGETVNRTVIKNVTYETTNTSDLQRILESNQEIRAELEAREERLRNLSAGGGGLFNFDALADSLPFGGAGIVVVLGAIVALGLVTRN